MEDALYCRLNARGRKQFANLRVSLQELARKYPDVSKVTLPAHKAAAEGRCDCLRDIFVVWNETGVASRDVNGATPLHVAARTNRIETVKWLLRYTDLTPLTTAKRGETPVHVAVAQGHIECVKVLLETENKASVHSAISNATDNNGLTPLHVAIMMHRRECAIHLINDLGLKAVNNINDSGITCCHIAAAAGNLDVLKHIAQKHKKLLSQEAADGATPVYYAAQEGHLEAVTFLHSKGKCSLDTRVDDGMKPIHAAAQSGHTHIVQYIVCQTENSSIFDITDDGGTPLHFAAVANKENTARWLVRSDLSGTLIHTQDLVGNTPAHDAAEYGSTSVLKLLLDCGADLYAKNNKGQTPYFLATNGKYAETKAFVLAYAPVMAQRASSKADKPSKEEVQPTSEEKVTQDTSDAKKPEGKKKSKHHSKTNAAEKKKKVSEGKSPMRKLSQQTDGSAPLEIDDEDFRLFRNRSSLDAASPEKRPPPPGSMRSELSEIVVRYAGAAERGDGGWGAAREGIDDDPSRLESGRESREMHRRSIRSIMDAIHSGGHGSSPTTTTGGGELGKPRYRSNPLVDDPHILAMAEQLQAQEGGGRTRTLDQEKATSSTSLLLAAGGSPRSGNPPTPPSTPLAATSAVEVLQKVHEAEGDHVPLPHQGSGLSPSIGSPQVIKDLLTALESSPRSEAGEEALGVVKEGTQSVSGSFVEQPLLSPSSHTEMQPPGAVVFALSEGSAGSLFNHELDNVASHFNPVTPSAAASDFNPEPPNVASDFNPEPLSAASSDFNPEPPHAASDINPNPNPNASQSDSQLQADRSNLTAASQSETNVHVLARASRSETNVLAGASRSGMTQLVPEPTSAGREDPPLPPSHTTPLGAIQSPATLQVLEPSNAPQQSPSNTPPAAESPTKLLVLAPTHTTTTTPQQLHGHLSATSTSALTPSRSSTQLHPPREPANHFGPDVHPQVTTPSDLSAPPPVTQLLILEPQRGETHLQAKPTAVHEASGGFKVQLRKRSQDPVGQPKGNDAPVNSIMAVHLRKTSQDTTTQPKNNEKPVNNIMAVQLRRAPQKQTIASSEATNDELISAFASRNRLKPTT